jgi:peptide/nickel transport system substrate-binding protein
MRHLVAVAAAVLLIVTAASVPVRSAAYGPQQTVVIAFDHSSTVSLDPQVAFEFTTPDHLCYSNLVEFARGDLTHPRPGLATSWTSSKDGRMYTFHLKPGVRFASGNILTSADVVYSFQRVVNIPKDPAAWLITQMGIDAKNVTEVVRAPDPNTVIVGLPKPFSPGAFLSIMANPVAGIVDSKTVQAHVQNNDWGTAWLTDHSAGSGPYQLVKWERLVTIELAANPNYNLGPAPAIKRIIWPNITENTVQRNMLSRGDADIALGLSASQLAALKREPGFYVAQIPELSEEYLGMDVKNVPAFGKAEVRRAVKYALDYDGIVRELLNGNGLPLQGIVPKGLFGYDPSLPFKHDPARAKQLLAEGGFGGGFTVTLLAPSGSAAGGIAAGDLASKVKGDLEAVGVHITSGRSPRARCTRRTAPSSRRWCWPTGPLITPIPMTSPSRSPTTGRSRWDGACSITTTRSPIWWIRRPASRTRRSGRSSTRRSTRRWNRMGPLRSCTSRCCPTPSRSASSTWSSTP